MPTGIDGKLITGSFEVDVTAFVEPKMENPFSILDQWEQWIEWAKRVHWKGESAHTVTVDMLGLSDRVLRRHMDEVMMEIQADASDLNQIFSHFQVPEHIVNSESSQSSYAAARAFADRYGYLSVGFLPIRPPIYGHRP